MGSHRFPPFVRAGGSQHLSAFPQKNMVRARGLEPPILSEPDPKSGGSAKLVGNSDSPRCHDLKRHWPGEFQGAVPGIFVRKTKQDYAVFQVPVSIIRVWQASRMTNSAIFQHSIRRQSSARFL